MLRPISCGLPPGNFRRVDWRNARSTQAQNRVPCAQGAIHWGNVRRVVFALSEPDLYALIGPSPENLLLPCREVFAHSSRHVEVEGPALPLALEARAVHEGFWSTV